MASLNDLDGLDRALVEGLAEAVEHYLRDHDCEHTPLDLACSVCHAKKVHYQAQEAGLL